MKLQTVYQSKPFARVLTLGVMLPALLITGCVQSPVSRLSATEREQVLGLRQMIDGAIAATAQDAGPAAQVGATEDVMVPGQNGPIRCRIYRPEQAASAGTVLFIHGGGWVASSIESHDRMARAICARTGVNLISVEYSLAPEAMFPTQLHELRRVTRWIAREGASYGLSARPLAVCGDSAGGNMAAVLARETTDGSIALAALIDPVVDSTLASVQDPETRAFSEMVIKAYVPADTDVRDPGLSPLLSAVPAGHPATFIAIGDDDPWRAQQDQYSEKLRSAGVKIEVFRAKRGHLGPEGAAASENAMPTIAAVSQAIRSAFDAER
jgi:acetyl esterase